MSVQMQVIYSDLVVGAASISGGVFWCAKGSALTAQTDCMGTVKSETADDYIKKAQELEKAGEVAPLINLQKNRLFVFSSSNDRSINERNATRLVQFYSAFMPTTHVVHYKDQDAAHGFPTPDYGAPCNQGKLPWLLNCKLDMAGEILNSFYGPLQSGTKFLDSNLKVFSQKTYDSGPALLSETGWIYIPEDCQKGEKCKLHVALHGCQMSPDFIQDQFVRFAGYNQWAEANDIVVLYPQTKKTLRNPQACWDWFGITGPEYVTRKGPQPSALRQMIQDLGL